LPEWASCRARSWMRLTISLVSPSTTIALQRL
jgi:hypothetical protein